jgi:ribonuclease VapC
VIAVDTSAIMAVILREERARDCLAVLRSEETFIMSAGTLAECLIVSGARGLRTQTAQLLAALEVGVVDVTAATAHRAAEIYGRWGKGNHPAGLNYGDCFAYDVARQHGCPLLYVGDEFGRTDVESAL